MQVSKTFKALLIVCNVVFLTYYIILGYFNMPALDDFCFIDAFNKHGFLNPITFWYQAWSGRMFPIFILNFVYFFYQLFGSFLPFTLFLIAGYVWVINQLIIKCSNFEKQDRFYLLNVSLFTFSVFLYANYKFNTFYWINASSMYYGGLLSFLLIINLILKKQIYYHDYLKLLFLGLYAGTSMEHHVVVFIVILIIFLVYEVYINKFKLSKRFKFAAFALFFISIGLLVLINAPGTKVRMIGSNIYNGQSLPLPLLKLIPAVFYKLALVLAQSTIVYLPFLLLCIPIFVKIIKEINFIKWLTIKPKYFLIIWLSITLTLVAISIAPVIYVLGMIGPQRVLIMAGTIFFVSLLILLVYIKNLKVNFLGLNFINNKFLIVGCFVIIIVNVAIRGFIEYPKLHAYRKNEIKKINYLKNVNVDKNDALPLKIEVQNSTNITYITPSEYIAEKLLRIIWPNQAQSWSLVLKNESIMPNYIDLDGQRINEDCYCNALALPFKIKTLEVK